MPLLQSTCATGGVTCHGDPNVAMPGFPGGTRQYFGPPTGTNTAATVRAVHDAMVNVPSAEDPTMDVVKSGNPTASYMMYKLDGTQMSLNPACASGDLGFCGPFMPGNRTSVLPQATRDMVRSWIAQGALDN
jgi:hypothetical protein